MKRKIIPLFFLIASVFQITVAQTVDSDVTVIRGEDVSKSIVIKRGMIGGDFTPPIDVIQGSSTMTFVSSGTMMGKLFPPDLIMRNQDKLNLSSRQVTTIKNEMKTFQSGIVDIQWDLNEAQSRLEKELNTDKIDVDRALATVDNVMKAENDLKKSHLALLIKIRNVLDASQLAELEKSTGFHAGTMAMPVPAPYSMMRWQGMQ
ncbi:MAG: hypothetical protein ACKVHQ_00225 [Gammaproteobacteria bacterium]|jgi:hypothetical protein